MTEYKYHTIYLPKGSPLIEKMLKDGLTVYVYEKKIVEVLKPKLTKSRRT